MMPFQYFKTIILFRSPGTSTPQPLTQERGAVEKGGVGWVGGRQGMDGPDWNWKMEEFSCN